MENDCPICGAEDTVTHHEGINDSEYKNGYFKGLILEYSKCSVCGSEFAGPDQINRNAQRARERMKEVTEKMGCPIGKPLNVWIDESVIWELREKAAAITLRNKLYGKPTRKNRRWKKLRNGF